MYCLNVSCVIQMKMVKPLLMTVRTASATTGLATPLSAEHEMTELLSSGATGSIRRVDSPTEVDLVTNLEKEKVKEKRRLVPRIGDNLVVDFPDDIGEGIAVGSTEEGDCPSGQDGRGVGADH